MSAGTATNVTTGKRRVDGGIYIAPVTATLPTDASTALGTAFHNIGYISEDGVTNSQSRTSQDIKEWNGDTVCSVSTGFSNTWKIKFIESLNVEVLKAVFGEDNVTEANGKISVAINSSETDEYAFVIDMAAAGDKLKRVVIPRGKITQLGDVVYKATDAVAYDATLTTYVDTSGNYQYEYIE